MAGLRIAAIGYLNTAPLMWDFDHGTLRREFEVEYCLPSEAAERLRSGSVDIGIIPVAAYAEISDLSVVPGVCISSRGAVKSILLISKVPRNKIKRVAVDTSSRSSVALLRVLFTKMDKIAPEFVPMGPNVKTMLAECDAALVIGDEALMAKHDGHEVFDLGDEWYKFTGKPFVYAFWAIRNQALTVPGTSSRVVRAFVQSRNHGIEDSSINRTGEIWSRILGISDTEIKDYLTRNINYYLTEDCHEGMELFFEYAQECGAIKKVPTVQYL
jgi:chorismate dehydratase